MDFSPGFGHIDLVSTKFDFDGVMIRGAVFTFDVKYVIKISSTEEVRYEK